MLIQNFLINKASYILLIIFAIIQISIFFPTTVSLLIDVWYYIVGYDFRYMSVDNVVTAIAILALQIVIFLLSINWLLIIFSYYLYKQSDKIKTFLFYFIFIYSFFYMSLFYLISLSFKYFS